jgi:uncharacterized protein (DUF58 family)
LTKLADLLKPEILHTVNGLELAARVIVEGFMSGSNQSQTIGSGQEFSQYRNYEPGDDLRQLDWKMYARSERYYIKQADVETNITVRFMIDASHSMAYEEGGFSKLLYAKVMTAALAYLARKQSDAFGLFTVNEKSITAIQPRFEQQQFMRFLNALVNVSSEGAWRKGNGLEQLFNPYGKEMIVFITDLYDDQQDIQNFISKLKTTRNEVIVFHLLGKHETEMDFDGSFTFEDLENKVRIKVDSRSQQQAYQARVQQWLKDSRAWMLEKHINYYRVALDEPVEQMLRDFLTIRKRMVR